MLKKLLLIAVLVVMIFADDYETGFEAYEDGDMKTAIKHWNRAAAQNDIRSQTMLGLLYFRGDEIKTNYKKAADMLSKVFAEDDETLHITIGLLYYKNRAHGDEDIKALKLFEDAVDKVGADAQYNLGKLFLNGMGVDSDLKKAAKLIKKAKDGGSEKAKKAWKEFELSKY